MQVAAPVALAALVACGDDDASGRDAAVDAAPRLMIERPREPAAPDPTCPARWVTETRGDRAVCVPFAARARCEGASMQTPGDVECTPLGAACPSADFPDDVPAGAIFVRPGATGSGTRSAPYGSLRAAIESAPAGATIVLARGEHPEPIVITRAIELRGACAAETRLTGAASGTEGSVIEISGSADPVVIRDLTVGPADKAGIFAVEESEVTLTDVRIEGASVVGLLVDEGATVTGTRVLVRSIEPVGRNNGVGAVVREEAELSLNRAVIEMATHVGLAAEPGGTLALVDGVVAATRGQLGGGISVGEGAKATIERVLVTETRSFAISAHGETTAFDLVVRDTDWDAADAGSVIEVVGAGGALRVSRGSVLDVEGGVSIRDGASATLRDLTIDGVTSPMRGNGAGLVVGAASSLDVARLFVARTQESGVVATDEGTTARLVDVVVRETSDAPDGDFGRGLTVQLGAIVDAERVELHDNHEAAIVVAGATLSASDVFARGTLPRTIDDAAGRGLHVQSGGSVTLSRARFEEHYDVSLFVLHEGSYLEASDVEVETTHVQACAAASCADDSAGIGVAISEGATGRIEGFRVAASDLCGVQLADLGGLDLVRGEVRDNAIGVCLQVEGFDVARLMADVRYTDNGSNLDSTALPVPSPLPMLGAP